MRLLEERDTALELSLVQREKILDGTVDAIRDNRLHPLDPTPCYFEVIRRV